jgi:hypothetical protein
MQDRVIAIGLLTATDLNRLGAGFSRAWPVDEVPCFGELLVAIDAADRQLWRTRDEERLIAVSERPPTGTD